MPSANPLSSLPAPWWRRCHLAGLGLLASAAVQAQPTLAERANWAVASAQLSRPASQGSFGLGSIASVDVSMGADRRPHHALRLRFDSAARAMRDLGVDADDCSTVLRTSRHASPVAGQPSQLGLTVALNCRFF